VLNHAVDRHLVKEDLPVSELPVPKGHHDDRMVHEYPQRSVILPIVEEGWPSVEIGKLQLLCQILVANREEAYRKEDGQDQPVCESHVNLEEKRRVPEMDHDVWPGHKLDICLDRIFLCLFLRWFLADREVLVIGPLHKLYGVSDCELNIRSESSIEHGADDGAAASSVPLSREILKRVPNGNESERRPDEVGIGQEDDDSGVEELTDKDGHHDLSVEDTLLVEADALDQHDDHSPDYNVEDRDQGRGELLIGFDFLTLEVVVMAERVMVHYAGVELRHLLAVALVHTVAMPLQGWVLVHLGHLQEVVH
jgi:hypothetical protein